MQKENNTKNTVVNGQDFCYFENMEGNIIGFSTIENATTIPDDAISFTYVHQDEPEPQNKFLRAYRIGKRLNKSIFNFELKEEIESATEYQIVTDGCNCDFCMFATPEKKYFYAIADTDVTVDNRESLNNALTKAIETKGAYQGAPQLRK